MQYVNKSIRFNRLRSRLMVIFIVVVATAAGCSTPSRPQQQEVAVRVRASAVEVADSRHGRVIVERSDVAGNSSTSSSASPDPRTALKREVEELEARVAQLRNERDTISAAINALRQRTAIEQTSFESARADSQQMQHQLGRARAEIASLEAQREVLQGQQAAELADKRHALEQVALERDRIIGAMTVEVEKRNTALQEATRAAELLRKNAEAQLEVLNDAIETAQKRIQELDLDLQAKSAALQRLDEQLVPRRAVEDDQDQLVTGAPAFPSATSQSWEPQRRQDGVSHEEAGALVSPLGAARSEVRNAEHRTRIFIAIACAIGAILIAGTVAVGAFHRNRGPKRLDLVFKRAGARTLGSHVVEKGKDEVVVIDCPPGLINPNSLVPHDSVFLAPAPGRSAILHRPEGRKVTVNKISPTSLRCRVRPGDVIDIDNDIEVTLAAVEPADSAMIFEHVTAPAMG